MNERQKGEKEKKKRKTTKKKTKKLFEMTTQTHFQDHNISILSESIVFYPTGEFLRVHNFYSRRE